MIITSKQIIDLKRPDLKEEITSVLKNRFSPRVFSDEEVKSGDLKKMIEAARWTPSSSNRQPWFFYVARKGSKGFEKVSSCLNENNYWAKRAGYLLVGCYLDEDERGKNEYAKYDLGQAVMSLVVQAQSLGYYSHQMAGFNKEMTKEILNIKPPAFPWVVIAIGKIGDYSKADQILIDKDNKTRKRKEIINQEI